MSYFLALGVTIILAVTAVCALVVSIVRHKYVQLTLVLSVFILGVVLYFPVLSKTSGDGNVLFDLLISAYNTLKLFLVDGEFEVFGEALRQEALTDPAVTPSFIVQYQAAALAVFIAAPITTATVIASYFKSTTAYLRMYTVGLFSRWYVFSKLNKRSLALAKDIHAKNPLSTIIFNDVYRTNEEEQSELLDEAKAMGALCLKRDVLRLRIRMCFRRIEFFLLGENETENIDQAVRLTARHKYRRNTAIYAWARTPESGCILDSLHVADGSDPFDKKINVTDPKGFKLRRINDVEIFAWNTLRDADFFSKCTQPDGEKRISLLIIGTGDYGMEYLKTAVWMYQRDDVRLEITVVDREDHALKKLWHECPELMEMNDCDIDGEAHYSLRFIENCNLFQRNIDEENDFENLLFGENGADEEMTARLQRTTAVFIALGDDDLNIRAALDVREMFDRVHYQRTLTQALEQNRDLIDKAEEAERRNGLTMETEDMYRSVGNTVQRLTAASHEPEIFTSVYDIVKSENITLKNARGDRADSRLRCYGDVPYNICFNGSFKQQNTYDTVVREKLEEQALTYHLKWSRHAQEQHENTIRYNQYEYYRRSSMAQAIHKDMIAASLDLTCLYGGEAKDSCTCDNCARAGKIEHMRWNAYMRAEGYRASGADLRYAVRDPRGKVHYQMVAYDLLTPADRRKDASAK